MASFLKRLVSLHACGVVALVGSLSTSARQRTPTRADHAAGTSPDGTPRPPAAGRYRDVVQPPQSAEFGAMGRACSG
jgi:hypothetical protein